MTLPLAGTLIGQYNLILSYHTCDATLPLHVTRVLLLLSYCMNMDKNTLQKEDDQLE